MQLRQDNSQRHSQSQRIAPHLIQANSLLQCSTAELMQVIEQEQRENPALDDAEDDLLPDAPQPNAEDGVDSHDDERQATADEMELARYEFNATDLLAPPSGDGDFDPLLLARAQTTLSEHLLSHLRATSASADEERIAEYLVNCLDERGYLQVDIDEACAVLRVPCEMVKEGMRRLQDCDPPGIGARDLRECLLLQMECLLQQNEAEHYDPIAARLVSECWEELIQRRFGRLARRLGVLPARLDAALHFIRTQLTPHPASGFRQPYDNRADSVSVVVRPDVVISRGAAGFTVDVLGFENMALHINPHYRSLYAQIKDGEAPALAPDHEKHVIAYVERAHLFLKNLQQRRRTIQKIARALCETQQGFLETGQRAFLRPLTRTKLAEIVGMHESTISRALLHKYVQLPSQEVVSFETFFEQGATTKDAVAALIAAEDHDAPLSDQAITEILEKRGTAIARRTVVKYREELRIPASYLRRRR